MFNPAQVKKQEKIEFRQKANKLLMPLLLLACFFVLGQTAKAAPANFTLSGGSNQIDNFCVDDDIYVYLNDKLIYSDLDPHWASCNNQPVSFQANGGDKLRVVAIDSAGICRGLGPIWLHYQGKAVELDSGRQDGCAGWPAGVTFYDKTFIMSQTSPDPVIIIPGIMGSWKVSGKWELDPILHTYDNLWQALKNAGYEEGKSLFALPYQWRLSNSYTAELLKQKIQEVKAVSGRNKVDIIAHSMGGLIARSYIQGSDYQNDIDQVVFLGVPHKGSPESYLKYEGAYFQSNFVPLQKYFFQIEAAFNGYFDLTDYIRVQVPTVEQLLPIFDYLKDKQADNSWQYW